MGTERWEAKDSMEALLNEWGKIIEQLMESGKFVSSVQLTEHYADITDKKLGYATPKISGTVRLRHMLELAQMDLLREELKKLDSYDVLRGPVTVIRKTSAVEDGVPYVEIERLLTDFVFVVGESPTKGGGKVSYRPHKVEKDYIVIGSRRWLKDAL